MKDNFYYSNLLLKIDDLGMAELIADYEKNMRCKMSSDFWKMTVVEDWIRKLIVESLEFEKHVMQCASSEIEAIRRGELLKEKAEKEDLTSKDLITVCTFNVNYAFGRGLKSREEGTNQVMSHVRKLEKMCDVIGFQEIHDLNLAKFDKVLRETFKYRSAHPRNNDAGGFALYSKFPITFSKNLAFPAKVKGSIFPFSYYELNVNGTKVLLVNVHLRPPVEDDGYSSVFSMLRTSPTRKAEMEYILKEVKARGFKLEKSIIMGDFNENDGMFGTNCKKSFSRKKEKKISSILFNPTFSKDLLSEMKMEDALTMTDKWTHWWFIFHGNGFFFLSFPLVIAHRMAR